MVTCRNGAKSLPEPSDPAHGCFTPDGTVLSVQFYTIKQRLRIFFLENNQMLCFIYVKKMYNNPMKNENINHKPSNCCEAVQKSDNVA